MSMHPEPPRSERSLWLDGIRRIAEAARLDKAIWANLKGLGYGEGPMDPVGT
jgi:hypothetical protein